MHDDHHDAPLPPPEPDAVAGGQVFFWGLLSFVFVLVSIAGLGGYFWIERGHEMTAKIGEVSSMAAQVEQLHADAKQKLQTYAKNPDGTYRILVEDAMKLVVRDLNPKR
jgi:hypothetical protein